MSTWGSPEELERRRRIKVSLWAYAYELGDYPLIDDATFDKECSLINPNMSTGNAVLDKFFKEKFNPSTGQWIYDHPELDKVLKAYQRTKKQGNK